MGLEGFQPVIDFLSKFGFWNGILFGVLVLAGWFGYKFFLFWLAKQENKAIAEVRSINTKLQSDLELKNKEISDIRQDLLDSQEQQNRSLTDGKVDEEDRISELLNHPFFLKLDYWIQYKIPDFKIKNIRKQYIFQDYAKIRYSQTLLSWRGFVASRDYLDLKANALKSRMTTIFLDNKTKTIKELERFKIPAVIEQKIENERILVDKYVVSYIEEVCDSVIYKDNISKLHAFFDFKEVLFEIEITDLLNKVEKMNGDLDGLEYR